MTEAQLDNLMQAARDVRFLLRITVASELKQVKEEAFGGDERKEQAFVLLGEGKSYRNIADEVGIGSSGTITRWVGEWRELGLVHPEEPVLLVSPMLLGIA